jgi:hypothetical protein
MYAAIVASRKPFGDRSHLSPASSLRPLLLHGFSALSNPLQDLLSVLVQLQLRDNDL